MPAQKIITITGNFHETLQEWGANGYSNNVIFDLGETSKAMQTIGARPLPVLVTGGTLSKAFFDHGIVLRLLGQIPDWLDQPVSVYKSATVLKGSVVVLSNALKNGDPIIVPIELDAVIDRLPTNRIKSVYSKPQSVVDAWDKRGLKIK